MTLTRRRRRRSNSPFPDAHSAVSAQVPEPDGFEHVPRVEVREREEGREKIQPRVRPRASEPSASVRRPSSPRVSRRTEKKKTDAFALPLRLRLDSQMHAFAVGGQLQACGGAEWAWGVPIRRAPLPIRRAEVGEGSGADSSRTFEKIYSRFIDSSAPGTRRPAPRHPESVRLCYFVPVRDARIAIPATSRAPRSGVCAGVSARTRAGRHGRHGVPWGERQ